MHHPQTLPASKCALCALHAPTRTSAVAYHPPTRRPHPPGQLRRLGDGADGLLCAGHYGLRAVGAHAPLTLHVAHNPGVACRRAGAGVSQAWPAAIRTWLAPFACMQQLRAAPLQSRRHQHCWLTDKGAEAAAHARLQPVEVQHLRDTASGQQGTVSTRRPACGWCAGGRQRNKKLRTARNAPRRPSM